MSRGGVFRLGVLCGCLLVVVGTAVRGEWGTSAAVLVTVLLCIAGCLIDVFLFSKDSGSAS